MKALQVRGTYRGRSGHDHHVREFVRELHRMGISIRLIDIPDWSPLKLTEDKLDPWFDSLRTPVESKVALHFCMPHQVKIAKRSLNVNFTMFEATRIPKKWVEYNRRHDLVILPTESSKLAWVESGFPEERIRLCPLGVDPLLFRPDVIPLQLKDMRGRNINEFKYRFLNVSNLIPRKNLLGLLRVWLTATHRNDDAILILKICCGSKKWLKKFFRSIETMEATIGKTRNESAPSILMINQILPDAEMPSLYAAATHYWSMSHGEGWDQPMIEAGATGLQLIAPDHSAYSAYLNDSVAFMIPAQRTPAVFKWDRSLEKLFHGAEWWESDETAAGEILRKIINHDQEVKSKNARARIAENFTWEKAARRLVEILENLEAFRSVY